jgi:Fe-Mn family superoxide dismutase
MLGAGLAGAALGQARGQQAPHGGPPANAAGQARGGMVQKMLAESYQNNQYVLPALPYPLEALEPHISAKMLELHHAGHHQAYVNGLNKAIRQLSELAAGSGEIDADQLAGIERDLSFNAGGHILHTIYWATMGGGQGDQPVGEIADAVARQFGSMQGFRNYFSKVATTVKGSGWAVLMYEPVGDRLFVFQVHDHDVYLPPGAQPLLPLDVWEHAYYMKYGPARAEYVQAWSNVINWGAVNDSFRLARSLRQEAAMTTSGR